MITAEIITSGLENELQELIGNTIFSNFGGNNVVILEEIEKHNREINLYCTYKRKYFQTIVKRSGSIAGWSKENKKSKGIPLNISINFTETMYSDEIDVHINSYYNGQVSEMVIRISNDEVEYIEECDAATMDSFYERRLSENPYVMCETDGKTIKCAIQSIIELIKVKLCFALENSMI